MPYYQNYFGEVPHEGRGYEGSGDAILGSFPIVTKDDLRQHFANLIARDLNGMIGKGRAFISSTGGSTGVPVSHMGFLERENFWEAVIYNRILSDFGVPRLGEMVDTGLHYVGEPLIEVFDLGARCMISWVSPGEEDPGADAEIASVLGFAQPHFIWGLPSRLTTLAQRYADTFRAPPLVILSCYEQLADSARVYISGRFGAPVVSVYNLTEAGTCAWECPAGRLHFADDLVVPEVVDAKGHTVDAGVTGRLLVTSLKSTLMPVIRYDTGDLAVATSDPCPCGKTASSIERFEGRRSFDLYAADGTSVIGYVVMAIIDSLNAPSYQIVQQQPGKIQVTLPIEFDCDKQLRLAAVRRLEPLLGSDSVTFASNGDWITTTSGKRNPIVGLGVEYGARVPATARQEGILRR